MTVCVGAIAERTIIVGASDRMLTAGDVEYEPTQSKIWLFSQSICGMMAGEYSIQAELMKRVHIAVSNWIAHDPKTWVKVRDVAALYCKEYRALLREQAEAAILHPQGLDFPSFFAQQTTLSPELVRELANKLAEFQFPTEGALEAIFMGIDNDGPVGPKGELLNYPQLYATYQDKLSLLSTVGFAAIGGGRSHAEAHLEFARYSPDKPLEEAALLVFAAKKRAQAAPGIGVETDVVAIGPGLGTFGFVDQKHVDKFQEIYDMSVKATEKADAKAKQQAAAYIGELRKQQPQAQPQPKPPTAPAESQKSEPAVKRSTSQKSKGRQ